MHAPTYRMQKSTPRSSKKQTSNPQELLLEKEVEQPSYRHPSFEPQHIYCHKVNHVFEFTMNKYHTTQSRRQFDHLWHPKFQQGPQHLKIESLSHSDKVGESKSSRVIL